MKFNMDTAKTWSYAPYFIERDACKNASPKLIKIVFLKDIGLHKYEKITNKVLDKNKIFIFKF